MKWERVKPLMAGSALASSECHCLNSTVVNATILETYNVGCAEAQGRGLPPSTFQINLSRFYHRQSDINQRVS